MSSLAVKRPFDETKWPSLETKERACHLPRTLPGTEYIDMRGTLTLSLRRCFDGMIWLSISCLISFILVAYAKCPDRQIGTTLKYNNQCLEFIRDQYYQPEALQQCQQYGGHLVTIESREKQVGSNHRVDIKLDSKVTEDDFCQPHAAMYLQLFHAMDKTCSVMWLQ